MHIRKRYMHFLGIGRRSAYWILDIGYWVRDIGLWNNGAGVVLGVVAEGDFGNVYTLTYR